MIVAIISPDEQIRSCLRSAVETSSRAGALWTISDYPDSGMLRALSETSEPCVVLLDVGNRRAALAVATAIQNQCPGAVTVGVEKGDGSSASLAEFLPFGIRYLLRAPFSVEDVQGLLIRVDRAGYQVGMQDARSGHILAFLPANPGSGATTLAVNTAAATARLGSGAVLLVDLDISLGVTSFLLKIDSSFSVLDALAASANLDDDQWYRLISERERLHILGSAPAQFGTSATPSQVEDMLDYARRRYATVFVDLPGQMTEQELRVLSWARSIVLVCTPDATSLHMAHRKIAQLTKIGLAGKVVLVLNRANSYRPFCRSDVEKILDVPVRSSIPSDENSIVKAVHAGVPVAPQSGLGRGVERLAAEFVNRDPDAPKPTRLRRFLEFFSASAPREYAERAG